MNHSFLNKIVLIILLFGFGCNQIQKKDSEGFENIYQCGAEAIDDTKWSFSEKELKPQFFGNIETQTKETHFSGEHCLKLTAKNQYGFTTELDSVAGDEYIQVTVWRKNNNGNGTLIIDGGQGFYNGSKKIIDEKDGWQQLFLEVFTPPTFINNKIKIFVWNNSSDSVYFDDLQIIHRNKKIYPEFPGTDQIQIHTDQFAINNFNQKRLQAFQTTVLENSDEDYSNIVLFDGTNFLNGSFRLKGDLIDHIQGQKWSFRIKLKQDFAWKNLRTFSIQNPSTRNFIHEWLAHKIFEQEDVLSTRYGFVPVKMNNESLGIYAWEEHFEKQLIESQNRREGPIVRFDESVFWKRVLETNQTKREWDIDYFDAAKIIPFKIGRTAADSMMNLQLVEAQKLMLQYKNRTESGDQIFDITKLAKYYALIDITQAYHGFTWHNQRFYYNPVTCLLEPIAFDGYIEGGIYKRIDEQITGLLDPAKITDFQKEEIILFQIFENKDFRQKYIRFLKQYSRPEFIHELISEFQPQTDSIAQLIKLEFPYYKFDFNYIRWQAEFVQKNMDKIETNVEKIWEAVSAVNYQKFRKEYTTDINKNLIPFQVHAYFNKASKQIDVINFHNGSLKILGTFFQKGYPVNFEAKPELAAYKGEAAPRITLPVEGTPTTLLFEINNEIFETEISQWAYSDKKTFRQIALKKQLPENIIPNGKTIIFKGNYQFKADVIIPDSFLVVAQPGTKIDLVEGASFVSFSPIQFIGNEGNPITIISSDHSANGFNILQPNKKSELKYVHFSGLSSLRKAGWQTPAAVTFYEADVQMEFCSFANNKNCDDALNVVRSDFYVENCHFENTFADAFDSDFCTGKVKNCTFTSIGNDAIDFSGSKVEIIDCKMNEITDKAISGGEHSNLIVTNCEINNANIGVAAKDLTTLVLDKITMNTTAYGLVAFKKKPEYGEAKITINNLIMKNNIIFHQIELGSVLILNGKTINGREKNIALKLYQ